MANQFTKHFSQKLSSGITRYGVSRHQDFKIFLGAYPQTPLVEYRFGEVFRLDSLLNAGIGVVKAIKCKIFQGKHATKASKWKLI